MNSNGYVRGTNVLAVDDQPANLLALEAVLENEHNVVRAMCCDEAIAILKARDDIDVILLDVQMPDVDGFETAGRIKAVEACQDIPIVFITAVYYEDPHIKRGYSAGAIDYFGKPFDPDILRMKIGIYASFRHRAHMLKERERQVRESEELLKVGRKLSAVLESLPVGVLIADAEGRIVQTTEEVSRILNSIESAERDAYGEILGWWDTDGKVIKDHDAPLARAVRYGEASHSRPTPIRCFDGSVKTIITSTLPLRGLDDVRAARDESDRRERRTGAGREWVRAVRMSGAPSRDQDVSTRRQALIAPRTAGSASVPTRTQRDLPGRVLRPSLV